LSGNQCVQAVLKLGPDSVSGNTIVQSAANTLMYISGDKVNIGTSSFATGTKLYLYDVASGPIIALSGLDSNYRGLTIKNTNDAEQWFIGNNASNNFVIRANSSNDILIVNASTSNVGIGTTTPGAKLDVNGSLAVRGSISFTGPSYIGASSRLLMVDNEGNVSATTTLAGVSMPTGATGQTLRYGASAWEATSTIYIKDGKVGIKTNTPTEALSVEGNVYINTGESSNTFVVHNNPEQNNQIRVDGDAGNVILSESFGNVGIGAPAPDAKLDVNGSLAVRGSVSFTGPLYTGTGSRLLMVDSSGNVSATSTLAGVSMPSGNTGQTLRYGASGWEATSTIHITNDGKVGIGTTNPGAKLEVYSGDLKINGGKLYLADTAGQNATYLQSYSGGSNLWMIQPGTTQSFIIADAISWDRSLSFNYTPGATGAGTGRLTIGQTSKNGTTFTHGITSLYTNGLERMRIDVNGNVGIGTTNPTVALHVNGNAIANTPTANGHLATKGYVDSAMQSLWVNSGNYLYASSTGWNVGIGTTTPGAKLDVNGNLAVRGAVSFTDATLYAGSGSRYLMIDNSGGVFATTTAGGGGNYVLKGGDTMTGTLHFETSTGVAIDANQNNIIGVNKLSVVIIDPLYDIGGVKYSSYAPSMVGGIKEEYVGRGNIKDCGSEFCSWVLDFSQVSKGSDLWVWRQIIDFRPETIEVLMTAYGQPALLSYEIGDNQIKFYSDRPTQFSYRLVGSRFDWRRWPTLAPDQSESTSLIIK